MSEAYTCLVHETLDTGRLSHAVWRTPRWKCECRNVTARLLRHLSQRRPDEQCRVLSEELRVIAFPANRQQMATTVTSADGVSALTQRPSTRARVSIGRCRVQ